MLNPIDLMNRGIRERGCPAATAADGVVLAHLKFRGPEDESSHRIQDLTSVDLTCVLLFRLSELFADHRVRLCGNIASDQ